MFLPVFSTLFSEMYDVLNKEVISVWECGALYVREVLFCHLNLNLLK